MTLAVVSVEAVDSAILAALSTVTDPESGRPITELGFVRSVLADSDGVTVHLRMPAGFCSPDFACLMASDAQDALSGVEGIGGMGEVRVVLDGHHDSERTLLRRAHIAAVQRCVAAMIRRGLVAPGDVHLLTLRDLPAGRETAALLRRRFALGFSMCPNGRVLVDDEGHPLVAEDVLRMRAALLS